MPSRTCWLSLASRNCVAEGITASTVALTLNDESGEAPACTACHQSSSGRSLRLH